MTTAIEAAFLASICECPDDDTPRLIFADFLEENGQEERAEFIRVQVELEPYRSVIDDPAWLNATHSNEIGRLDDLRRRERELRSDSSCALDWLQGSRFEWDYFSPVLRRGFIEEVTLSLPDWLEYGKAMMQETPLRIARLTCGREDLLGVRVPFIQALDGWLRRLAQDDEPGDNPVCRLHTLDLTRLSVERFRLAVGMDQAYRPWRGLRVLILPNWASLEERYRPYEIEQWKKRVPSLQTVQFGTQEEII